MAIKAGLLDLNKRIYKKQLVAVINSKGEKEVWVNCFCDSPIYDWHTKIYWVDDGASCYFNFKINLNTKKHFEFVVNSAA